METHLPPQDADISNLRRALLQKTVVPREYRISGSDDANHVAGAKSSRDLLAIALGKPTCFRLTEAKLQTTYLKWPYIACPPPCFELDALTSFRGSKQKATKAETSRLWLVQQMALSK